jgi:hypothetical protein
MCQNQRRAHCPCLFNQATGLQLTVAELRAVFEDSFSFGVILKEDDPEKEKDFGPPIILTPGEAVQFMIGQEIWRDGADDGIITFQFTNGCCRMTKKEYCDIVEVGEEVDDVIK